MGIPGSWNNRGTALSYNLFNHIPGPEPASNIRFRYIRFPKRTSLDIRTRYARGCEEDEQDEPCGQMIRYIDKHLLTPW